ncbi:MAG: hypothetical protein QFX35_02630 [Candidatus Verstraetearchaeota archaeon]|nr:hypothetical protein [Candidatus Verstraetearchaeota archaeon]
MEELEEKLIKLLQSSADRSLLQSDLWKSINSNSREVSRALSRMEKRGIVKREPFSKDSHKTYKVMLLKKEVRVQISDVVWCSCFTCPDLTRCGMSQPISPENCIKLTMSLRNEYLKYQRAEELKKTVPPEKK